MLALLFNTDSTAEKYRLIIDDWPDISEGALASLRITQEQEIITSLNALKNKEVSVSVKFFEDDTSLSTLKNATIFNKLSNNKLPNKYKLTTSDYTSPPFYIKEVFLKTKQPICCPCLSSNTVWSQISTPLPDHFLEIELIIIAEGSKT